MPFWCMYPRTWNCIVIVIAHVGLCSSSARKLLRGDPKLIIQDYNQIQWPSIAGKMQAAKSVSSSCLLLDVSLFQTEGPTTAKLPCSTVEVRYRGRTRTTCWCRAKRFTARDGRLSRCKMMVSSNSDSTDCITGQEWWGLRYSAKFPALLWSPVGRWRFIPPVDGVCYVGEIFPLLTSGHSSLR